MSAKRAVVAWLVVTALGVITRWLWVRVRDDGGSPEAAVVMSIVSLTAAIALWLVERLARRRRPTDSTLDRPRIGRE